MAILSDKPDSDALTLRVFVGLPKKDGTPRYTSLSGHQPVCLCFGDLVVPLTPTDARELAIALLDATYESFSQAVIARFLVDAMQQKPAAVREVMAAFAKYRIEMQEAESPQPETVEETTP